MSTESLPVVRAAAEELVGFFDWAEERTDHWSDRELTESLAEAGLTQCLTRLAGIGCWGPANRLPSGELWQIAGPLLEVGSLQRHARLKPHGYAGDYEMLSRIWEGSCCEHPLGHAMDRYFQRQGAPEAVRARTRQIAALLAHHCLQAGGPVYHVVSVGSGPGIDVRQGLAVLPRQRRQAVRVTLLDLDPYALDYARRELEPLLPPGALSCLRENLARLPARRDPEAVLAAPDFLICSGLFDYLDDEAAAAMLRLFWQQLAPGGMLVVGNFAPHNPSRAYMEWIGNWYLTYRTAGQMEQVASQAGMPRDQFTLGTEATGIDLLLVARKE